MSLKAKVIPIVLFGSYFTLSKNFHEYKKEGIPTNEFPMYGGLPRTPTEQKIDEKFINGVIRAIWKS